MSLRVAELESLFTANITPFEQGAQKVETTQKRLDGTRTNLTIDTNAAAAVQDLDRVESSVRAIPDGSFTVEADTGGATRALDGLESDAEAAGRDAGAQAGEGLSDELVAAIVSIPIAGAIIGAGVVAGKALFQGIQDGLQVEVGTDRLLATTGLDPASVAILGRAAGEAYASNWGESISANLDSARIAVQGGILDPESTKAEAQAVIESIAGVSDVVGAEAEAITRTVATLLRTGLAANADEAFDIIVTGSREGLDLSGDLLDTLNEYSTQFRALGLDAPAALGLMRQALEGGARDTDVAADALKEFAIRGKELDDSGDAYKRLGLNAEDMAARVARGGEDAATALGEVMDALRDIDDPVARSAASIELFGTKSEDLQQALYQMDLSTAVDELGTVEGAARTAMGQLSDNAANSVETAQRNIEIAATGIKGALAEAFAPQIEGLANTVTENREAVVGFLLDIANGALDTGRAFVNGMATSTEAVGDFASTTLPTLLDGIATAVEGLDQLMPGDQGGAAFREFANQAIADLESFDTTTETVAAAMRENLITNGIDPIQERLNTVGDGLLEDAALHDASVRLANDIDAIGTAGGDLQPQLEALNDAMLAQAEASRAAGEDAETLRENLDESRGALERQLEAMGLSKEEAAELADAYGLIPDDIVTTVATSGVEGVLADLNEIEAQIRYLTGDNTIRVGRGQGGSGGLAFHDGGIIQPMAYGGILGMAPMAPIAQMVPPNTLRVLGDRIDVDEAYIPLDRSPRSMAILLETMQRMGIQPMARGGVTGGAPTIIPQSVLHENKQSVVIQTLNLSGDGAFENEMERLRHDSVLGSSGRR